MFIEEASYIKTYISTEITSKPDKDRKTLKKLFQCEFYPPFVYSFTANAVWFMKQNQAAMNGMGFGPSLLLVTLTVGQTGLSVTVRDK